jgi:hypothetical protein
MKIEVKHIASEFRPLVWRMIGINPESGPDWENVNKRASELTFVEMLAERSPF